MSVLGFDPSLTACGYGYDIGDGIFSGRIVPSGYKGVLRLAYIEEEFGTILDAQGITLLTYEGYSMGGGKSRLGRSYDIGELGGVLKLVAWKRKLELLLVPPACLKMYATGNGRADKSEVIAAVERVWGYTAPNSDEADAVVLLKMGQAFLGSRQPRRAVQRRALEGCTLVF